MYEGRLVYTDPETDLCYTYDLKEETLEDVLYFIKKIQNGWLERR